MGQVLHHALADWAASLQWPDTDAPGGEKGVTWVELAIDMEIATGTYRFI